MIEVRSTDNFTLNLPDIEAFWDDSQFPQGFDRLIEELTEPAIPNLTRHPRMGRNFLSRKPQSVEALARAQKLDALLGSLGSNTEITEVREYVMTDYLLLYALTGKVIYLLAVKHHKQLSFDIHL